MASNIWQNFSLYNSVDLISRFYKEKHGREISAGKAYEIVSHLMQGQSYFSSARQADEMIRPLLLYYGVLSLSRGLILFLNIKARECSIQKSHGLDASNWGHILSKGIQELPNLQIKFQKGTFSELSRVTENKDRGLVYLNGKQLWLIKSGTKDITYGDSITLRDILARIPELCFLFKRTFNEFPQCFLVTIDISSSPNHNNHNIYIKIWKTSSGLPDEDDIRKFSQPTSKITIIPPKPPRVHIRNFHLKYPSASEMHKNLPLIRSDHDDNPFIMTPCNGLKLSSLSFLYLIAYATGMLARYYPSHWISLINGNKGSFVYPLLKGAIQTVEERFPELLLEEFEERDSDLTELLNQE